MPNVFNDLLQISFAQHILNKNLVLDHFDDSNDREYLHYVVNVYRERIVDLLRSNLSRKDWNILENLSVHHDNQSNTKMTRKRELKNLRKTKVPDLLSNGLIEGK